MPFDLMHPNKNRSRSVQLDQATASATTATPPASSSPNMTNRSSSLAHRDENTRPVIRSMLDVESAPTIAPLKALDLNELHVHREVMPLSDSQPP